MTLIIFRNICLPQSRRQDCGLAITETAVQCYCKPVCWVAGLPKIIRGSISSGLFWIVVEGVSNQHAQRTTRCHNRDECRIVSKPWHTTDLYCHQMCSSRFVCMPSHFCRLNIILIAVQHYKITTPMSIASTQCLLIGMQTTDRLHTTHISQTFQLNLLQLLKSF